MRFLPRGRFQRNRISRVPASSSRSSIDHRVRVNSGPSSGWPNSQATACMPSEMNSSRNARGSVSSRRLSRSIWWVNVSTDSECSSTSTCVRLSSSVLLASTYRCRSSAPPGCSVVIG